MCCNRLRERQETDVRRVIARVGDKKGGKGDAAHDKIKTQRGNREIM